jgi:hypothetical protein
MRQAMLKEKVSLTRNDQMIRRAKELWGFEY